MDVTIAIATFGDPSWRELANDRARPSAIAAGADVVAAYHGDSLHEARNELLEQARTEWIVYLDADDELEPGYLQAMAAGTTDVRGPMARYVRGGRERLWQPRVAGHEHDCTADCLPAGNWLLIGSMVRTELLRAAGGWRDFAWSEDWDTWVRCWKHGATFELIRDAVYRAHVRPDSRNRGATQVERLAAHEAIHRANFPELHQEPVT